MIFASDLDRTLIYSKRAFLLENGQNPKAELIETLEGKEISFMTDRAIRQLQEVAEKVTFIPVTTRTTEQFNRISVFSERVKHEYAVTSNGANVLKGGKLDEDWGGYISRSLANDCLSGSEVLKTFKEIAHEDWVLRTKQAEDFFLYSIIDTEKTPADELLEFEKWLSEQNWRLSLQGRKLYFVPNTVCKAAAVNYIKELTGKTKVLAAGDSKLDLPMLEAADHAICPGHGELFERLGSSQIAITRSRGIMASEEILDWVMNMRNTALTI